MGPRDWAFLACKVLALYTLIFIIPSLPMSFYSFFSKTETGSFSAFSLVTISPYVTFIFLFVLFWFGAPWLSKKMAPQRADQESYDKVEFDQLFALAIAVFGIFVIFSAIPNLAFYISFYFQEDTFKSQELLAGRNFIELVIRIVAGFLLVVGNQQISRTVKRMRAWS